MDVPQTPHPQHTQTLIQYFPLESVSPPISYLKEWYHSPAQTKCPNLRILNSFFISSLKNSTSEIIIVQYLYPSPWSNWLYLHLGCCHLRFLKLASILFPTTNITLYLHSDSVSSMLSNIPA